MLATMLRIELAKLRGTLALLLCFIAPSLVAVIGLMIAVRQGQHAWHPLLLNVLGLWSYIVLPMTVATLAALLAQVEHGPRAWDHLFALPIARWRLVVAKAAALMILIGAETVLLVLLVFFLGASVGMLDPGGFPWNSAVTLGAATWAASTLMAMIQLWAALASRSFVAPVGLGLAGTFLVVASMGAPEATILPWAMPLATIPVSGGHALPALLAGAFGGAALLPAMAAQLARREF
jgi:ABC-2 type transport system permease protein